MTHMIDVAEAQQRILATSCPLNTEVAALSSAVGRVLAEDVYSDIDSPPYSKSLVDGYAVRAADIVPGVTLEVIEELTAGSLPQRTVQPGQATRIMTGAAIPHGADAVVMQEHTVKMDDTGQRIAVQCAVHPGENILARGATMRTGDRILSTGRLLRPADVGLLAEVGKAHIRLVRRPQVAIVATGDELVEVHQYPQPGQIRNSNLNMLTALVQSAGSLAVPQGIVRDQLPLLRDAIKNALQYDVVLITGGVSVGIRDYVPQVLQELGVEGVFHGVRLKPGKPLWYGLKKGPHRTCWVFGLPGNPVSSLVCFELFVRPLLDNLSGFGDRRHERRSKARLAQELHHAGDRETYFPAVAERREDALWVKPLDWKGSADLRTLADSSCLVILPAGVHRMAEGDTVAIQWLS
jgi:molybdopterin molybdotransferase